MWQEQRLGKICELISGQHILSKDYNTENQGIGYLTGPADFGLENPSISKWTESPKVKAQEGDILLTVKGSGVGKTNILDVDEVAISRQLMAVRVKGADTRFIYNFLVSRFDDLQDLATGAAIPGLSRKQILSLLIPLPPLPEQQRIVAILDDAFERIDAAIANTEKNLANARELFESYLNDVFTRRGEGWEIKSVGEIAAHCLGKMLDKKKNKGIPRPYLRNLNVRWFHTNLDDLLEMKIEDSEIERYEVQKGDLLISEGGYPGRASIWEEDEPIFFQKAIHRVRAKNKMHNRWIMYFLYHSHKSNGLKDYFTGAGIQHFTGSSLKRFKLPIAPQKEMEFYLERFESLYEGVCSLEELFQTKLTALTELKQSILQKAFAGELTADMNQEALVN